MNVYKFWNFIIVILLAIFLGVLVLIFYPYRVSEFNLPYQVHPTKVEAGTHVFYTADYCKYKPLKAQVTRTLVNSTLIYLPTEETNLDTGCRKVDIPVEIPLNTPPGMYHLDITLVYKLNPLREVTYKLKTVDFEVTNACFTKDLSC